MKKLLYLGLLSVCVLLGSCVEKNVFNAFDKVERYMDVYSDSALLLLEQIPHPEKLRGKQRADYVLLLTQARDKNYLDSMQSDSLIKLAVDYYKNGGDNVKAGKALFYYGKVSSVYCFQKAADTLGVIYAYRDIARIYYVEQQYDSVYNYINRALSLCEEKKGCIDFERVTPSLLQVKGIAKRNEGDLENAIILLKTAVETEQDRHSMHHCSMSLGNIYLNQNKLDEAKRYFTLALKSERPRTLAGAYHYLYLLEKRQKKYAMALYFKEKSDSLLSVDLDAKQASQILTLQRKYEKGKLLLEKQQVEHEKKIQFYFGMVIVLFIILLCLVLYFLLRKRYKEMFRKNMQVIKENECMIKRYVYELDVLKQKAGETAETNREKVGKLNQKILLLESENKKIRENVCVNGVYLLDQLKKEKLIVKNMTKQEKEQLLEYMDLIYGNLISRLKKDFKLTSGNLILIALLKVGFTTTELMFTFDCEMNSIFTKKRRLRESLNLDTTDKLEEFITLY